MGRTKANLKIRWETPQGNVTPKCSHQNRKSPSSCYSCLSTNASLPQLLKLHIFFSKAFLYMRQEKRKTPRKVFNKVYQTLSETIDNNQITWSLVLGMCFWKAWFDLARNFAAWFELGSWVKHELGRILMNTLSCCMLPKCLEFYQDNNK